MAWRGRVKVAVGAGSKSGVLTGALQVHLADGSRGIAVLPKCEAKVGVSGHRTGQRCGCRPDSIDMRLGVHKGHLTIGSFKVDALLDETIKRRRAAGFAATLWRAGREEAKTVFIAEEKEDIGTIGHGLAPVAVRAWAELYKKIKPLIAQGLVE